VLDFLGDLQRTHMCGGLRLSDAGKKATIMGWVNKRRDLGNLIFIDVRDRSGVTQVVFDASSGQAVHEKAETLRNEYVVAITGHVAKRDSDTVNKNIPTGEVELVAEDLRILNTSQQLPFLPSDTVLPNEEMRLKYRYIDLRREKMQYQIQMRHDVALAIRQYLAGQGFLEIETPFMTRSTPEGARDYLVPSRVHGGQFYALPQSPQLFKQILMISGFDKYFQIVRCFRDEDLRADRQPEFTQIDLEMSFPTQDRVFEVVEGFLKAAFHVAGVELPIPFLRMTYDEAIKLFGSDKPDMRLPAMTEITNAFTPEQRQTLGIKEGDPILAVHIPNFGVVSGTERRGIIDLCRADGKLKPFDYYRLQKNEFADATKEIDRLLAANPYGGPVSENDFVVIVTGPNVPGEHKSSGGIKPEVKQHDVAVYTAAGQLRIDLAKKYADRHKLFAGDRKQASSYKFLWVTDFPMFERDDENNRWAAAHHPFTSPHEKDMDKLESDPGSVRANAYDVVLNGTELGSGSIRIHRQDIQSQIFKSLGMSPEEAQQRFGFFLEALQYGTPPHGGIALGLDRIVMILAGGESLRDVIPFPKTAAAKDLMVDAPTPVSESQLKDLSIKLRS
jgi:aspartyl-tRNA synthetase